MFNTTSGTKSATTRRVAGSPLLRLGVVHGECGTGGGGGAVRTVGILRSSECSGGVIYLLVDGGIFRFTEWQCNRIKNKPKPHRHLSRMLLRVGINRNYFSTHNYQYTIR